MTDIEQIARTRLDALDHRVVLKPDPALAADDAYRVAASIRVLRQHRGETTVGRKIGFTNSGILPQYGISDPIWGYMYDSTVFKAEATPMIGVSHLLEPRIEPEICFGIAASPSADMEDDDLLQCIDWVAHGFEIVQSLFPDWKMGAADAIAAHGMHGILLVGEASQLPASNRGDWAQALVDFNIRLECDGETIDTGTGANVLGSPLAALRHLADLLAEDPVNPGLSPGEIVTTGSLTGAYPVAPGQSWCTHIEGLPLNGLAIRIE